ncbi:Microtubule-associated protein, partial [Pseudoloma neurophilia]
TNQPCHIFEMTDEIQNDLISGLSHSIWKERLEAAEKIAQNLEHAHLFTSELNKRLKDSNNQVFSTALFIIKNANLNFDRDVLLHKLADKKLQQKIKESNLINVTEDDFSGKRSPEIDRMLIEMAIQQGNKSLLSQIAPLESSARKDVREEVKKYKEFCANKSSTFVTPKKTLKVVENVPSKLQTTPLKQKTPTPQKVKNVEKTTITQNDIDNFSLDEPLTLADQRAITGDFFEKYNFFTERDFKKKLEKMECSENQLLQEPNFLKFVYSIKEKNKIMNIKYLELISRLQIIDTPLFCHIIVKIFTDPQIFSESSEICKKLDERKTLIFFIKFICQNKKGKLFEKGAEMVLRVQDKVMIEENCLDVNNYVGKEKQTLINLKAELEKRKEAQIKKTCPFFDEKQPENIEETLVQEFENSVVLDSAVDEALPNDTVIADNPPVSEPQVSEKITPVEKRQKNKNVIEHQNRFKDGKDQKKYFTEDMQTLFQDYKIEASDFIIKHIFEEKKCLCGQKDGFYCCLKKLIDFYADKRYVLSAYEAETFVKLIKNENLLQDLEKIYPKSKILILKNKENHFKTHLLQSFRFREYNMSPLRKKKKPETQKIRSPVPIIQTKTANVDNFVVAETFNDSFDCLEEPALIQNKPDKNAINVFSVTTTSRNSSDSPFDDKKDDREHTQNIFEISKLGKDLQTNRLDSPQKIIEKRLSTNSINNFLITDLYKKSDSAFVTLLQRATDDLPSLFYIANSIVNALIENFEDIKSIKILMILSTNSDFLSEVDFDTMKMLHLRIIKDIQDHGGDFLINLCLNAPVPALLRVYLAILNDNKEIVLKLIWRNSKRKYNQHAQEIMSIFDDFFSKNMELDDLTFKILQLHISEIVSQRGSAVLDFPITGQLHKIVTGMLERLSQNESN